jgi:hypothetical protein
MYYRAGLALHGRDERWLLSTVGLTRSCTPGHWQAVPGASGGRQHPDDIRRRHSGHAPEPGCAAGLCGHKRQVAPLRLVPETASTVTLVCHVFAFTIVLRVSLGAG